MIVLLGLPQLPVMFCQAVPDITQFHFLGGGFLIHLPQFFRYLLKALLQLTDILLPGLLVGFGPQNPGIQFRLADIDLLCHGVIAPQLGLNGGSLVQFPDDGVLARLNLAVQFLYPALHRLQLSADFIPGFGEFLYLQINLGLLGQYLLFVPVLDGDLRLHCLLTVFQVSLTALGGIDLLLQHRNLALQLPPEESCVI